MWRSLMLAVAICAAGAWVGAGGCATPSVHPIYGADEPPLGEAGIVGRWRTADNQETTYVVSERGDAYRMVVRSEEAGKAPEEWAFDVRLTKIGEHRFADFAAPEGERRRIDEKWGPLFVPTHMFLKWELEGDSLRVWLLDRDWLERGLREGRFTLGATRAEANVTLITAETAELREFLGAHGGEAEAWGDATELSRVK